MRKRIFLFVSSIVLLTMCFTQGVAASSFVAEPEADEDAVVAYLFLSDTCPWCRKLKQEGFAAKFRQQYAGSAVLKEYEIHSQDGRQQFSRMTKKHNLSGGVPVLIVGDTVLPGYSENMLARAGEAVRKERQKQPAVKKTAKKKENNLPAVIGIVMEDDDLQGVAPAKDMEQIKRYVERVQDENGETLGSMNAIFNHAVCNKAMAIVNVHEQKLKTLAAKSPSFAAFKKSAAAIEAQQQKQLNELMRNNTKSLR